jgi:hypothetical protein
MEWIKVSDRLPEPETPVLVHCTNIFDKTRILRACWIPLFYMSGDDSDFSGNMDYNDEKNEYYWPEGWYEWNEVEDTHWLISLVVLNWMPLPEPPKD